MGTTKRWPSRDRGPRRQRFNPIDYLVIWLLVLVGLVLFYFSFRGKSELSPARPSSTLAKDVSEPALQASTAARFSQSEWASNEVLRPNMDRMKSLLPSEKRT